MRNETSAAELYLASKNLRRYSGALGFNSAMKIPHFSLHSVPYINDQRWISSQTIKLSILYN